MIVRRLKDAEASGRMIKSEGLECRSGEIASAVTAEAFKRGLVIETAGNRSQVVKCFCPLTVSEQELNKGLDILEQSVAQVFKDNKMSAVS